MLIIIIVICTRLWSQLYRPVSYSCSSPSSIGVKGGSAKALDVRVQNYAGTL